MRPIDADVLDCMLSDAQAECKRNGGNFRFGVLSNIRENIKKLPTIDAIPVEWLINQRIAASEGDSLDMGILEIIALWQKEQEAKTCD